MAPWNIVFLGAALDYIDYDTRDKTYDALVPRAYEVMEVLFNYKRTVEDFKECGGKAGNPYNFPFVSECVGPSDSGNGPCRDSAAPVPCGDGTCRSDYVACLRALSDRARREGLRETVLWGFREHARARAERGLPESADDAEALAPPAARAAQTPRGDAYFDTLFGARDRARGTARPPDAPPARARRARAGGAGDGAPVWGGEVAYDEGGARGEGRGA
jgi:hypothetical protein